MFQTRAISLSSPPKKKPNTHLLLIPAIPCKIVFLSVSTSPLFGM